MHSAFPQLFREDGRTEGYKGTNRRFLSLYFPNSPKQGQGECTLLVFGVTERQGDCYVECVTVQHIECTDSVQCANELYLV